MPLRIRPAELEAQRTPPHGHLPRRDPTKDLGAVTEAVVEVAASLEPTPRVRLPQEPACFAIAHRVTTVGKGPALAGDLLVRPPKRFPVRVRGERDPAPEVVIRSDTELESRVHRNDSRVGRVTPRARDSTVHPPAVPEEAPLETALPRKPRVGRLSKACQALYGQPAHYRTINGARGLDDLRHVGNIIMGRGARRPQPHVATHR